MVLFSRYARTLMAAVGGLAVVMGVTGPAAAFETDELNAIFGACQDAAENTPSPIRETNFTIMWCAVVDREGVLELIRATDTEGTPNNPDESDAWRGSVPIAIAKAWTALAFSSRDVALDSKTIGLLARLDSPIGGTSPNVIGTNAGVASLFGIGNTNLYTRFFSGQTEQFLGRKHQGIVTFAGGQPVYECGTRNLLGGVGVSGDGVDQDDIVAKGAVTGAGFCLEPQEPE